MTQIYPIKKFIIFILLQFIILSPAFAAIEKKVKVSSNDTTAGYLNGKLVAGSSVSFAEGSDGGNETLTISVSGMGSGDGAPTCQYIEGATADDYETILCSTDPTGDRTINFPNADLAASDVLTGSAANTFVYSNLANAELLIGDGSGAPSTETLSGDVTMTNAGVVTIANNAVALSTDTSGDYVATLSGSNGIDISGSGGENAAVTATLNISGDVVVTTGVAAIQANSVALSTDTTGDYVKSIADAGNTTITVTGSGEGAEVTLDAVDVNCSNCIDGTDIAIGSDATGDIMYYDGTDWTRLAKGTNGQYLKIGASIPTWDTPAGAGDMLESVYDTDGDGEVNKAEALAANGANCSAGNYPLGVDASGAVENCTAISASTGTLSAIEEDNVQLGGSDIATLDFLGADFDLTEDPDTEVNVVIAAALTRDTEWDTVAEINAATTDNDVATLAGTETLTNKTLTSPKINEDVAVTATATEINYIDGVTSAIQTQLDTKDAITTAGRSLTRTTNDFAADAELYTHTFCWNYPADPVDTDDNKSIWINNTDNQFTVTKLWCESDQTVTTMLQVDDGSAADMDSVDLVCISTPDTDTSLDGDATIAAGDRVDVATTSVSGTPTWATVCFTGTWDD